MYLHTTLFPWSLNFQATLLFGISILLYVGFREIFSTLEVINKLLSDYVHTSMLTKIREGKCPGDPGKVTVFSNSAGSFCTFCLYVSPQCEVSANSKLLNYSIQTVVKSFFFKFHWVTCSAQGLFHRVICQSGPLISNSSPMQVELKTKYKFLNCGGM